MVPCLSTSVMYHLPSAILALLGDMPCQHWWSILSKGVFLLTLVLRPLFVSKWGHILTLVNLAGIWEVVTLLSPCFQFPLNFLLDSLYIYLSFEMILKFRVLCEIFTSTYRITITRVDHINWVCLFCRTSNIKQCKSLLLGFGEILFSGPWTEMVVINKMLLIPL